MHELLDLALQAHGGLGRVQKERRYPHNRDFGRASSLAAFKICEKRGLSITCLKR
jgi:hypothetical protein